MSAWITGLRVIRNFYVALCPHTHLVRAETGRKRAKYNLNLECGIDCPCADCKEIRKFLLDKESSGEIHIIGTKEDLKKLRKDKETKK